MNCRTMACQDCSYSKLESDPESDQDRSRSDLKIHIESAAPLLDEVRYGTNNKTLRNLKKKRRVLSTLDIAISIFIVTPCVVGCWRGVWQLMDIYANYFPAWESFAIGMATHMVLALGQDVFHYVIVEKEMKNCVMKVLALFLMKFYIITFNVITNLIWRGAWILFDRYCRLNLTATGVAMREGSSTAIWFTIVCTLILFCLKGLRNTLSPPFSVALDSKNEVFLFSTRYIYKIVYLTIAFTKQDPVPVGNQTETAEKLVSSQSTQIESYQKQPPRPFGIKPLGPPPQEFTPTTTTAAPTTLKMPTLNYPQLTHYRNNYYPKNIQDIIGYVTRQRSYNMEKRQQEKQQASNQEDVKQNYSEGFTKSDPFYSYKPTDPSEINLLATASFRFAPPIWKNFQKMYQQPNQLQQHMSPPSTQHVEDSSVQESVKNFVKPFVVTLNIYPMENDYPSSLSRYGKRIFSQITAPLRTYGDSRTRVGRGNKMAIHLNVFPENIVPFIGDDNTGESTVNKIRFV